MRYVNQNALYAFESHLNVFIEDQFKTLNLMQNELYKKTYLPLFCVLIKTHMAQDLENKKDYEEILQKMNCTL